MYCHFLSSFGLQIVYRGVFSQVTFQESSDVDADSSVCIYNIEMWFLSKYPERFSIKTIQETVETKSYYCVRVEKQALF